MLFELYLYFGFNSKHFFTHPTPFYLLLYVIPYYLISYVILAALSMQAILPIRYLVIKLCILLLSLEFSKICANSTIARYISPAEEYIIKHFITVIKMKMYEQKIMDFFYPILIFANYSNFHLLLILYIS